MLFISGLLLLAEIRRKRHRRLGTGDGRHFCPGNYFWREMPQIRALVNGWSPSGFSALLFRCAFGVPPAQQAKRLTPLSWRLPRRDGQNIRLKFTPAMAASLRSRKHGRPCSGKIPSAHYPLDSAKNIFRASPEAGTPSGNSPARHLSTSQFTGGGRDQPPGPVPGYFLSKCFYLFFRPRDSANLGHICLAHAFQRTLIRGGFRVALEINGGF